MKFFAVSSVLPLVLGFAFWFKSLAEAQDFAQASPIVLLCITSNMEGFHSQLTPWSALALK